MEKSFKNRGGKSQVGISVLIYIFFPFLSTWKIKGGTKGSGAVQSRHGVGRGSGDERGWDERGFSRRGFSRRGFPRGKWLCLGWDGIPVLAKAALPQAPHSHISPGPGAALMLPESSRG